jgi:hypothetical protein
MVTTPRGLADNVPSVSVSGPARFSLTRSGGAIIHGRLDIWADIGKPAQKRVDVLFFEDSLDDIETFSRSLPKGVYGCVMKVFVVEDLNGTFEWTHSVGDQSMLTAKGDVNQSTATDESQKFRDEYLLIVR